MLRWKVILDNGSEYIVSATDKSGAIHEAIRVYHILLKEVDKVNQIT
jgi:hypothetical protein